LFAISLSVVTLGLLALLWRLFHRSPRLVIGERGILAPGRGWGWIPWDEVEGAYPPTAAETETLRVRLRMTERLARVLRARRRLRADAPLEKAVELRLDLSGSDRAPVEVLQEILVRSRAKAAQSP
jgi:hypothetical protein